MSRSSRLRSFRGRQFAQPVHVAEVQLALLLPCRSALGILREPQERAIDQGVREGDHFRDGDVGELADLDRELLLEPAESPDVDVLPYLRVDELVDQLLAMTVREEL